MGDYCSKRKWKHLGEFYVYMYIYIYIHTYGDLQDKLGYHEYHDVFCNCDLLT